MPGEMKPRSGNMRRMTLRAFAFAVAVLLLATCASRAEAGWTAPSVLLRGDGPVLLDTTVRGDGSRLLAIGDGKVALGLLDRSERVVLRSPAVVGEVALAADGSGVALEIRRRAPSSVVAFDAQGVAQPPLALDDRGDATVAISPGGAAVAAWVTRTTAGYEVDAAFRDPGSATFGAPARAGYSTTKDPELHAGIGERGEAVVMWQDNYFPSKLAAAVRLPGAAFSPARYVSDEAIDAQLAVGPGGQAIIAVGQDRSIEVSIKPPGADAMPAARTLDRASSGYTATVAAAGDSRVALAWLAGTSRRGRVQVRVYEGASGLRRVGTLGDRAGGEYLGFAIDAAGAAVLAWEEELEPKGGDPTARAHLGVAYRPAGRRFGAPRHFGPVSIDATPVSTAMGPGGRAYVFYEAFGAGRRVYMTERTP
jgi:hypothetical protein